MGSKGTSEQIELQIKFLKAELFDIQSQIGFLNNLMQDKLKQLNAIMTKKKEGSNVPDKNTS